MQHRSSVPLARPARRHSPAAPPSYATQLHRVLHFEEWGLSEEDRTKCLTDRAATPPLTTKKNPMLPGSRHQNESLLPLSRRLLMISCASRNGPICPRPTW